MGGVELAEIGLTVGDHFVSSAAHWSAFRRVIDDGIRRELLREELPVLVVQGRGVPGENVDDRLAVDQALDRGVICSGQCCLLGFAERRSILSMSPYARAQVGQLNAIRAAP